jgi:hypothetical protein
MVVPRLYERRSSLYEGPSLTIQRSVQPISWSVLVYTKISPAYHSQSQSIRRSIPVYTQVSSVYIMVGPSLYVVCPVYTMVDPSLHDGRS